MRLWYQPSPQSTPPIGPGEEKGRPVRLKSSAKSSGEEQQHVDGAQSTAGRQTWVRQGFPRRVLKARGSLPSKNAKQARNSATKMTKRQRMRVELVALYAGGVRIKSILWPDEAWVDGNTCARHSPQNDKHYYRKSTQGDSVSDGPKNPIKRRTPGIMAHIALRGANGGVC